MKKLLFYILAAILAAAAIAIVALFAVRNAQKPAQPSGLASESPAVTEHKVVVREVEKLVEVEKEIGTETISDGLRDMGVLITQEYYFTQVVSYSSIKKLLNTNINIPFTESSYLASYDGVVTAGIDFSKITVTKNDDTKTVTVTMPKAQIRNVDLDPNSFVLYSEKDGLGNPISAADFNSSLIELENTAKQKALDKDILEKADANGKKIVSDFVNGLLADNGYKVEFK